MFELPDMLQRDEFGGIRLTGHRVSVLSGRLLCGSSLIDNAEINSGLVGLDRDRSFAHGMDERKMELLL